jgi:hypothetical protein
VNGLSHVPYPSPSNSYRLPNWSTLWTLACAFVTPLLWFASAQAFGQTLGEIVYSGVISTHSQRGATVQLVSGPASRRTRDQDILPNWVTKGSWSARHPSDEDTFNAEDQQQFCSALAMSLVHVGLFKQAAETNVARPADINFKVTFNSTVYHVGSANYTLDVDLQISGDGTSSSAHYLADSKGGHRWIPDGMSGADAFKTAAAADLLHKMMPDIENWMQQGHTMTQTVSDSHTEQSATQ